MKLCVATSFEDEFLEGLDSLNDKYGNDNSKIYEVYGAFPLSVVGSARAATILPKIDEEGITRHIEKAHSYGIDFNFLLNASCLGNREYTREGVEEINNLLDTISDMGTDTVTIAIPYLIEKVKKRKPHLKINASTICYIDSPGRAQAYEEIGVDRITLDIDVNRNFELLQKIRDTVDIDLEVLANNSCLLKCPYKYYHYNLSGHGSQKTEDDDRGKAYMQYPVMKCTLAKLLNHKEIIKSPWIRPEDAHYYTNLGIDMIKISGRQMPTGWLLEVAEAYLSGKFNGNLLKLLEKGAQRYFQRNPLFEVPERLNSLEISIDNRSLDGFIDFFREHSPPCNGGCGSCNYCGEIAERVIFINDTFLEEKYVSNIKRSIGKITADLTPNFYERRDTSWKKSVDKRKVVINGKISGE